MARSMRNALNGARLTLSAADIPALESAGSAEDVTRGARRYSRFLDMSARYENGEKRVKLDETCAIRCRFACTRKARKGEGHNTRGPWIF